MGQGTLSFSKNTQTRFLTLTGGQKMNIKSLLLGSAAALVAVSGARAADAVVVAEPEPVEYVRVCDVYGTGFYYMPGTETCLKVSGYMRYDIGVGDLFGLQSIDKQEFVESGIIDINDTYYKRARFQLRVDARSETELGTLRAYGAFNFQWDANQGTFNGRADLPTVETDNEFAVNHAYIELGGFLIGKTDSLFTTFTDYAGTVINDDFAVPFGPYDTHTIQYKFDAGNGFTAAIALEEGDDNDAVWGADTNGDGVADTAVPVDDAYTLDEYIPHVVAGVGYTGGWGGLRVVGGYDAVWEEFAVKAKLDVKATEALSLFIMAGYKSSEDFSVTDPVTGITRAVDGPNWYGNWGGDWAVWGGGRWVVTEKAAINVQLAYDEFENFSAVANVDYELVPGFTITPEIAYADNFDEEREVIFGNGDDEGEFGGFLRFQRNF
jgi:Porin subfamily